MHLFWKVSLMWSIACEWLALVGQASACLVLIFDGIKPKANRLKPVLLGGA